MNRVLQISFLCIALISCASKNNEYKDYKNVQFALKDSFAIISLLVPSRYDTFAKWTHEDCTPGDGIMKYRLQPKSIKLYLENGFIDTGVPQDSVENITIQHSEILNKFSSVSTKNFYDLHYSQIKNINQVYSPDESRNIVKSDTVKNINGQLFSIVIIDLFDTKNGYFKKAIAETYYKGNFIKFICIKQTMKNDKINSEFIQTSMKIFESIKISNGI